MDQPLVVINMPGAGGSIGSRKVKNARPDGYTLLQIHEGMLTNKYSGNANFGPESYRADRWNRPDGARDRGSG